MNNLPQDRVRIFNRQGFPLAEFRALVTRSWLINEEGRAQFTYASRKTEVVNDDNFRFGNWLLVENDSLPSWVGVIDPPRSWSARDTKVSAYTPERVFSWRRGPLEEVVTDRPGGQFAYILHRTNQAENTLLRAGGIDMSGEDMQETYNPTLLSDDLKRIIERSGYEYQFRPSVEGGRLVVYADWQKKLGIETSAILQSGKGGGNLESVMTLLAEDGEIVNELLAYGDGETWTNKPNVTVQDLDSIYLYGLRQGAENYSGVTETSTLTENGTVYVTASKQPVKTYKLVALNVKDTFRHIALGNKMKLLLEGMGFQTGSTQLETVRIIGMSYTGEIRNKITLVVEVVV